MHREENMVGQVVMANYNRNIFARYFHISRHKKPGKVWKTIINTVATVDLLIGRFAYAG